MAARASVFRSAAKSPGFSAANVAEVAKHRQHAVIMADHDRPVVQFGGLGTGEHYARRTGLAVTRDQWRFYEVFGLFRLAVIAQQIWYRYVHGQTHNEAYAVFGPAVAYLEQRCRRLLGA